MIRSSNNSPAYTPPSTPRKDGASNPVPRARPTAVTGQASPPGVPCIVSITMGSPSPESNSLMAYFRFRANERGYPYQTLVTGSDLDESIDVLRQQVPPHATVVLILTDASPADVATLRAALPTRDIIIGPQGEPLNPNDPAVYDALDYLQVARPEITPHTLWNLQQLGDAILEYENIPLDGTPRNGWCEHPLVQCRALHQRIADQAAAMRSQGLDLGEWERWVSALAASGLSG